MHKKIVAVVLSVGLISGTGIVSASGASTTTSAAAAKAAGAANRAVAQNYNFASAAWKAASMAASTTHVAAATAYMNGYASPSANASANAIIAKAIASAMMYNSALSVKIAFADARVVDYRKAFAAYKASAEYRTYKASAAYKIILVATASSAAYFNKATTKSTFAKTATANPETALEKAKTNMGLALSDLAYARSHNYDDTHAKASVKSSYALWVEAGVVAIRAWAANAEAAQSWTAYYMNVADYYNNVPG